MSKILVVGTVAFATVGLSLGTGCDEEDLAAMAPELAPLVGGLLDEVDLSMLKGVGQGGQQSGNGDLLQTQQRDQLRDGSCGDGPAQDGSGTQTRQGDGQGNGDQSRMRDGSCVSDG